MVQLPTRKKVERGWTTGSESSENESSEGEQSARPRTFWIQIDYADDAGAAGAAEADAAGENEQAAAAPRAGEQAAAATVSYEKTPTGWKKVVVPKVDTSGSAGSAKVERGPFEGLGGPMERDLQTLAELDPNVGRAGVMVT